MALLIVLIVALTSLVVLVVMAVALLRHLKLLSASLGVFRDQVQPILEDISAGAAAAQVRLDRMSGRAEERKR